MRNNLRKAVKLLREAGWQVKDGILTNTKTGQPMKIEFLLVSPLFERIVQPYMRNLDRLGIKSSIRLVDSAQYTRRLNNFDYDVVVGNFAQSESPGNEQRDFWGSEAADREGSTNLIGIKDPAIDKLIDHVIFAKDREELVAATRALDRVLLWNDFVVPQWFSPNSRIAYWHRYGQPETLPGLTPGFLQVWWFDQRQGRLPFPSRPRRAERLKTAIDDSCTRRVRPCRRSSLWRCRSPLRCRRPNAATACRPSAISPSLRTFKHFAYVNPDAPKGRRPVA